MNETVAGSCYLVSMIMILRVALIAALLAGSPALADEASHRALAERLLRMTGVEEQVQMAYENVRSSMMTNFDSAGAPPEARPVYEKFIDDVLGLLAETLSWESIKDDYVDVFVNRFSEDEIQQLIAFYETPLGQRMLTILPELYQKGAEIGQRRFEQIKPQIDELTDKLLDDIDKIRAEHGEEH